MSNKKHQKYIDYLVIGAGIAGLGAAYELQKFKQSRKPNDQILYCGDYMENPSTEGALTSGIKTSQFSAIA